MFFSSFSRDQMKFKSFSTEALKQLYLGKGDRLTASPSPPSWEPFLACHSPRRCTLISDPINRGKAIRGVIIPTSSSDTSCELSVVNTLNPGCCGFMYQSGVTVVHMINSKLYINFLVRVKYEWLKLDDFTMVFCPGRNVWELMPSFLKRET